MEGYLALMIPIFALMIPIVAILTKHQKEMAQTYAQNQALQGNSQESAMLREEVRQLRETVSALVLKVEDLSTERESDVATRVRIGE